MRKRAHVLCDSFLLEKTDLCSSGASDRAKSTEAWAGFEKHDFCKLQGFHNYIIQIFTYFHFSAIIIIKQEAIHSRGSLCEREREKIKSACGHPRIRAKQTCARQSFLSKLRTQVTNFLSGILGPARALTFVAPPGNGKGKSDWFGAWFRTLLLIIHDVHTCFDGSGWGSQPASTKAISKERKGAQMYEDIYCNSHSLP